jgi:cysteine desulfurase
MTDIYFDNAASTRVREEVIEAMLPYFHSEYGNAAGLNTFSMKAKKAVNVARDTVAELIGANPEEICFTSGGTESNNLAIQGFLRARNNNQDHFISSRIEHDSIKRCCNQLELEGWDFNTIETDAQGKIILNDLKTLISPATVLISVMHGNNEIGTLQPIGDISTMIKEKNIIVHTDAAQTLGKIPFNVVDLNIDMATFSAHKLYGPKGIGALYVKKGVQLQPLFLGGGQENNLRAGTVNTPLVVGFAKALELIISEQHELTPRLYEMQTYLIENILALKAVKLNGPADLKQRVPGNLHFSFENIEGEALLLHLNLHGIATSSGSACRSEKVGISHVLQAIGYSKKDNTASLRISLGRENTMEECNKFLETLKQILTNIKH